MSRGMINMMSRRLIVLVTLVLVLAPAAHADGGGPVFGLRAVGNPKLGYFVYDLAPGATKTGGVIVSNTGNRAGTVKLYAADAATGRTTGTVYMTNAPATHTGAWVQLDRNAVTLAPGHHVRVSFTVRVPAGAKPGQWVAGIVAETRQATQAPRVKHKANVRIRIRNLTIVAVQTNVPGPTVVGFTIGSVTPGGQGGFQQVVVHFANTGNHLVKPTGAVTIVDSGGKVVETLPFKMDTFLPHTAIDYPLLLAKALRPGDYRARIKLELPAGDGAAGKDVVAEPAFSVSKHDVTQVFTSSKPTQSAPGTAGGSSGSSSTPWAIIAAAVVAAIVLALLAFQLVRRRRGSVAPVAAVPLASTPNAGADCEHEWDADYDDGHLAADGVWRFPHRCRKCGFQVLAADASAADSQAAARRATG